MTQGPPKNIQHVRARLLRAFLSTNSRDFAIIIPLLPQVRADFAIDSRGLTLTNTH